MTADVEHSEPAISAKLAFLTAVQFLTRIPVPGAMSATTENHQAALRASILYFPLVGVLIGVFTTVTFCAANFLWSALVASILAIAAEAFLTGAFHEDALADATDALGGGWTREQVLAILKDSRHGTYGVLALVIGVSLRIALISNLSLSIAWLAIPFSAGLGRWSILIFMHRLQPIQDRHTMARDVGSKPSGSTILWGAVSPILCFGVALACICAVDEEVSTTVILMNACFGFALALVFSLLMTWYYASLVRRRIGGVTGDFLGANCYLVQLVTLLAIQARV